MLSKLLLLLFPGINAGYSNAGYVLLALAWSWMLPNIIPFTGQFSTVLPSRRSYSTWSTCAHCSG